MSNILRKYIMVPVFNTGDDLIPLWDPKLKFVKDSQYGNGLKYDNHFETYRFYEEAVMNLKTKEITPGIVIDIYPDDDRLEHPKGETIYRNMGFKKGLMEDKVKDIVFKEYDNSIWKGSKLIKEYRRDVIKGVTIEKDKIYCLRNWKPFWVMESDDAVIEWSHELHKKYDVSNG